MSAAEKVEHLQSAPAGRLVGPTTMSSAASTPKADAKPEPAVAAALSPRTRWVEKALHENEIEPATELVADLPEAGDTLEP